MLTHRVSYNPHIHIAQNLIVAGECADRPAKSRRPMPKTPGRVDADLTVALPAPSAPGNCKTMARASARSRSADRAGRSTDRSGQPECQRTAAASALDAGALRRADQAHAGAMTNAARSLITGSPAEARGSRAQLAQQCGARCVLACGANRACRIAGALLRAVHSDGDQRFRAIALCGGARVCATIVLFGPETPKLYQPLGTSRAIYAGLACSPCVSASNHRKTACDRQCLHAGDRRGVRSSAKWRRFWDAVWRIWMPAICSLAPQIPS